MNLILLDFERHHLLKVSGPCRTEVPQRSTGYLHRRIQPDYENEIQVKIYLKQKTELSTFACHSSNRVTSPIRQYQHARYMIESY